MVRKKRRDIWIISFNYDIILKDTSQVPKMLSRSYTYMKYWSNNSSWECSIWSKPVVKSNFSRVVSQYQLYDNHSGFDYYRG